MKTTNNNKTMCTGGDGLRLRRRSHEEMIRGRPATSRDPVKMPVASVYAASASSADDDDYGDGKGGGVVCSSAARVVIAVSTIALLWISLLSYIDYGGGTSIKDLSDAVMELHRQIQLAGTTNEEREREIESLERLASDREIELAWERQRVEDEVMAGEIRGKALTAQIMADREIIEDTTRETSKIALSNYQTKDQLRKEQDENASLRAALASALEELARAREQLPASPDALGSKTRGGDEGNNLVEKGLGHTDVKKRKLRAARYQPGDNIEIIEYEDGGKVALRPGIVEDINSDGTYDIVKFEQSLLLRGMSRGSIQTYHTYPPNTQALYQIGKEEYVPITIKSFIRNSAQEGFELHGSYEFYFDEEDSLQAGQAMRIHRYAALGEVVGPGSLTE